MKITIAPLARRDLVRQFDFLIQQGAGRAARNLERRLANFIEHTLAKFPQTGTYLAHRD